MEQLWSAEALRAHWVLSSGELELLKEMLVRRGLVLGYYGLGVANCNHNWFGLQSSRFLDRINCDYRGVKTELIANETTLFATRLQSSGSNHIICE